MPLPFTKRSLPSEVDVNSVGIPKGSVEVSNDVERHFYMSVQSQSVVYLIWEDSDTGKGPALKSYSCSLMTVPDVLGKTRVFNP